jgi:hypothetical protein
MGLEELRAIQEFVKEHGWKTNGVISFTSMGDVGCFKASWLGDVIIVYVHEDGELVVGRPMSSGVEGIFRKHLSDPNCLGDFGLVLRTLWA